MGITAENGLWVANYPYEQRHIPKQAGFWWHGGGCRDICKACKAGLRLKVWWTFKPECAARLADDADESAKALMADHLKTVEASKAVDANLDIPKPAGLEYLPYQRGGIAYALGRESTLFGDEMGLGKTIQALGVVNATPSAKNVLVICPASLRLNWQREAEKWLIRLKDFSFFLVTKRNDEIPEYANFIIVNYDLVRGKMIKTDRTDSNGKVVKEWEPSAVLSQLMARQWDILIVDECHKVKNPKSLQSKSIIGYPGNKKKKEDPIDGLITRAQRKLFLTGTPILNRPIELQPLAGALAPNEFGNFFAFAKRYANAHRGQWGWDFTGASNLEELQERLRGSIMVRRLKRDVLKELPAKRRQIIPLPTNGAAKAVEKEQKVWREHEDLMEGLRADVDFAHASGDKEAYEAAVKALRDAARVAFAEISAERKAVAIAKIPKVIEHLESAFEQGTEKIVVFGHHHEVCNSLVEHFGDAAVRLTGEDSSQVKRQESVDRFQNDPSCKLFVGSIGAAGVGLTLTAASTVIFAELDWVPANLTQAEDRAHRIGQTEPVLVQHLVIDGSLDARMAQMVVDKQNIADAALDKDTGIEVPVTPKAQRRPSKYPPVSDTKKAAAHTAMIILSGYCDGAREKDGMGFNRLDSRTGKKLAALTELTDGQAWLATQLARRYQKQLPSDLLATLGIGQ